MNHKTIAAVVTLGLLAATGCTSSKASQVTDPKALAERCTGPAHSYLALDVTGSGRGLDDLNAVVRDAVAASVVCGGRMRAVVFASSSAASEIAVDETVSVPGETANAKARRAPKKLEELTAKIRTAAAAKAPALDARGSDPVAQFGLIGEWAREVGDGQKLATVKTDGLQNQDVTEQDIFNDPKSAASRFTVPNLTGVTLRIVGVGKTTGVALSTPQVDSLKVFYNELCTKAGAASCVVSSEVSK